MNIVKPLTKMPYDIVVTDFDDTLLRSDLTISDYTRQVLKKFIDNNGIFCISTGRMYASIIKSMRKYGLSGKVITYNGAMITDSNTDEVLFHRAIPHKKALKQLRRLEDLGAVSLHLYHDDTMYIKERVPETAEYERVCQVTGTVTNTALSELVEKNKWDATKILAILPPDKASEQLMLSRAKYGQELDFSLSKPYFLEVMEKGINKGAALKRLCDIYGTTLSRTLAFGDGFNDIEMLNCAGRGYAVENSSQAVKAAAGNICPSNDDDGVARTIEKYCFT